LLRIDLEKNPHIRDLMSPEDQARFQPGVHPPQPEQDSHPLSETDASELKEQRHFANWLLLKGLMPPAIWHKTNKRSTGTVGTPDFVVPLNGLVLFMEFKRPGLGLSPDQEVYRLSLEKQRITLFICYSSGEAIERCKVTDPLLREEPI
jgi:hypothetical protein